MPILFVPLAILGMTACSPQNALHTRLPFARCDRRQVLAQPALVAAVLSAGLSAPAHAAVAPKDITTVKLLTVKAKKLRASVRTSAGNRRSLPLDPTPGVNNYASTTGAVLRAKKEVLQPLLAAMKVAAASSTDLPDEITKPLKLQPLLMQGQPPRARSGAEGVQVRSIREQVRAGKDGLGTRSTPHARPGETRPHRLIPGPVRTLCSQDDRQGVPWRQGRTRARGGVRDCGGFPHAR